MATEEQVRKVVNSLAEPQACRRCGTRIRFGDLECSHCGADLEDVLRAWSERLLNELSMGSA